MPSCTGQASLPPLPQSMTSPPGLIAVPFPLKSVVRHWEPDAQARWRLYPPDSQETKTQFPHSPVPSMPFTTGQAPEEGTLGIGGAGGVAGTNGIVEGVL